MDEGDREREDEIPSPLGMQDGLLVAGTIHLTPPPGCRPYAELKRLTCDKVTEAETDYFLKVQAINMIWRVTLILTDWMGSETVQWC